MRHWLRARSASGTGGRSTWIIRFSNSTDASTRAFSILASAHFTGCSAATLRSIPVSQHEKFASYLVPFSLENSIKDENEDQEEYTDEKMDDRFGNTHAADDAVRNGDGGRRAAMQFLPSCHNRHFPHNG